MILSVLENPGASWTCFGLVIVYNVIIISYRLYFSPLARFPGPKLAAASKWYEFYFDFCKRPNGQFPQEVDRMHRIYGPIVRINPNELHIKDADFYEILYADGSKRNKYYPAAQMTGIPKATFGTVEHELHRSRRAVNMQMFSKRAVYGPMAEILAEESEALSHQFRVMRKANELRDVRAMFLGFTSVFSARYFIGGRLDYQENRESLAGWYDTVIAIPRDTALVKQFPWMTNFGMMLPRAVSSLIAPPLAGILSLHDFTRLKALEYLQDTFKKPDGAASGKYETPSTIFEAINRSTLTTDEKSYDRMWQEAFNVFFASVDTTSRTLAYATYYLMCDRDFLERLRVELDATIPLAADVPDYRDIEKLPLLTATAKETIRCMQLISGRIPVVCPTDILYGDTILPAGTPLSMSINDTMTDSDIFPEPHKFVPDRWLDQGTRLHDRLDRYWRPFGKGPRQCQGITMAWAIILRGLACVHRRFEFGFADDFDPQRDIDIVSEHFFGDPCPESRGLRLRVIGERD